MNAAQANSASREELIAENNRLEAALAEEKYRRSWLERQLFGTKSERFVADDTQMRLELGVAAHTAPVRTQTITYERHTEKKDDGHCRGAMPTNLPVKDIVIEPAEDITGCERIGEEISWRYEMKRGSLYIERTIRPKYVSKAGNGIAIAALPPQAIDKGNAGPGLLAQVITDKYVYALPLDRQRRKYKAEYQVDFSESVMCDWVRRSCFWIEPVYGIAVNKVRKSSYVQADETPIQVLVTDVKGKTHRGYFWVYRAVVEKIVVFVYSPSRSRAGPNEFLKGFKGVLQVDGYAGYNEVLSQSDVIWAACMAHVRRGFDKALPYFKDDATYALKTIKGWFDIEKESKDAGLDYVALLAVRTEKIAPSMKNFHGWLKEKSLTALPQEPLGKAVSYALNQWKGFDPFLTDGRVELSNNGVENDIRPVAVGRKNYLFKGSHDAAQRGAMIYTIVETARNLKLDPYRVVHALLKYLPAAKSSEIASFGPDNWVRLISTENDSE
jgi:transposase